MIAALVEQARERGIPVMVVTGDRDAYQLVGDGVRIMTTSRGITDTKVYDREGVIERYGIPPEKIPDFIGLKGDTSDNIPGVPGIGDKTASELLQRFGDLETVLASVDEISGAKRKQNLVEHADAARLSKQLATMVRDVPIELDLEAEFTKIPDRSNLRTGVPRLGAARPAAAPRGGAVRGRGRGDTAARGGRGPHRAGQDRRHARPTSRELEGRRAVPRGGRARGARGRADPARGALAVRRLRRRQPGAGRRDGRPGRARRRGRRAARGRPRRQGARQPSRRTSSSTPSSPPTCSTPLAAASRSTSCPRNAAWPSTPRTRTPPAPS